MLAQFVLDSPQTLIVLMLMAVLVHGKEAIIVKGFRQRLLRRYEWHLLNGQRRGHFSMSVASFMVDLELLSFIYLL